MRLPWSIADELAGDHQPGGDARRQAHAPLRPQPEVADLGHQLLGQRVGDLAADLLLLGGARRQLVGTQRLVDRAAQARVELDLAGCHGEILHHHHLRPRQHGRRLDLARALGAAGEQGQ